MRVACLCPTYRRPVGLVENTIACFQNQTYPLELRQLVILDDDGNIGCRKGDRWRILSVRGYRWPSLPTKYNAMVALAAGYDVLVVWEDDDVYLPWHIEAHVKALENHQWSHPEYVWTLMKKHELNKEPSGGRFHASLAVRTESLLSVGGWPLTPRGDFDLQLMANLRREFGEPGNPCVFAPPSYCFRWGSTGSYHGQGYMSNKDEGGWYSKMPDRAPIQPKVEAFAPHLDEDSVWVFNQTGEPK